MMGAMAMMKLQRELLMKILMVPEVHEVELQMNVVLSSMMSIFCVDEWMLDSFVHAVVESQKCFQ